MAGIPRRLPAMTYTATGFSNPVRVVFQAIFGSTIAESTPEAGGLRHDWINEEERDGPVLSLNLLFAHRDVPPTSG